MAGAAMTVTRSVQTAGAVGLKLGLLFGPAVFGVTAAGVALPDVADAFDAGTAAVNWVLTAYAVALGLGMALFGQVSDGQGTRTTLLAGSAVLGVGALICLLAPTLIVLVIGRAAVAVGSGAVSMGALALVAATPPEDRPVVLARFGGAMAVFAAGATLTGGLVTDLLSWRITLVLPTLSLLAVPGCLPLASATGAGQRVDALGAAFLSLTVAGALVLMQAPALQLAGAIVALIAVVCSMAAVGLGYWIRRCPEGFVPHWAIQDRGFLAAAAVGAGVYGGLFAAMYATPQILVATYGWSVLRVGLWLLPGAVAGAVLSRVAGAAGPRVRGGRIVAMTVGGFAVFLAAAAFFLTRTSLGPVTLVVGASLGFAAFSVAQVIITAVMSARLTPARRGGGMGLLNLGFFVGGGTGSAIVAALSRWLALPDALAVVALLPLLAAGLALTLPGEGR